MRCPEGRCHGRERRRLSRSAPYKRREEATQRAYNDLIALVRAEDASLVADDTKKRVASERYDEARATWLASLLAKASELGVPAAARVVADGAVELPQLVERLRARLQDHHGIVGRRLALAVELDAAVVPGQNDFLYC